MSACETCWTEASRAAQLWGGVAADWYPQVLAKHPDGHGVVPRRLPYCDPDCPPNSHTATCDRRYHRRAARQA